MPVVITARRAAPLLPLLAVVAPLAASPGAAPPAGKAWPPPDVEIRCADDSVLKAKLLDEKLHLTTKYGSLQIPVADVRRIDFATRTPPEVTGRVMTLISQLGHADFATREKASAQLVEFRERAYHPLARAAKEGDPEVSRRAADGLRSIRALLPPGGGDPREFDVVVTDDAKLTGLLTATTLQVRTGPFGEQALRLADIRTLRAAGGAAADDVATAPPAPANMMAFQNQFGKELVGTITGLAANPQGTGVWGTDVYTLDSTIAAAAVHAGVVQPGQTAVVRVRVVASPPQFMPSLRNGISSTAYGHYGAGGYEFVRR